MSFFSSVTSFFAEDDEPDESAPTNASASSSSSSSASRSQASPAAQRSTTSASTPTPTAGAGAGFFSSLTSAVSSISSSGAEFLESLQAENKDVIAAVNSVCHSVVVPQTGFRLHAHV